MSVHIEPVPCLTGIRDNYAYIVANEASEAIVVDPSEADPLLARLRQRKLRPTALWLTHHHWDHIGGIDAIHDAYGPLPVLGSAIDYERRRIPRQTKGLNEGDTFDAFGLPVRIMHLRGHTQGALAYLLGDDIFVGDTLFLGGCGRTLEGTCEELHQSLERLRTLPSHTRVWCGHEYTVKNLQFALQVEPGSSAIASALARAEGLRANGQATVPGTIEQERSVNPFLRVHEPLVAQGRTPLETFTALRRAKDAY